MNITITAIPAATMSYLLTAEEQDRCDAVRARFIKSTTLTKLCEEPWEFYCR